MKLLPKFDTAEKCLFLGALTMSVIFCAVAYTALHPRETMHLPPPSCVQENIIASVPTTLVVAASPPSAKPRLWQGSQVR